MFTEKYYIDKYLDNMEITFFPQASFLRWSINERAGLRPWLIARYI